MVCLGAMENRRGFGFWTGWFVVIASMVGSGILTNSGPILRETGSYSTLALVWVLGGILALAGALTLGELASGIPGAGGDYHFVKEAFGSVWGFVYGWAMGVFGFSAPIALVSYTTAVYLSPIVLPLFSGAVPENVFIMTVSSSLIIGFSLTHCLGHLSSSSVQVLTTLFNFTLLLALPVGALFSTHGTAAHFTMGKTMASVPTQSWGGYLILVLYAYTGWNAATFLSGEMRNPRRNLPLSLTLGCLAVTVLYLAVNFAYVCALSPEIMAKLSETEWQRLAQVSVTYLFNDRTAQIFSFLVSMGVLAALSAYILTGPRIFYAMAKDGLFLEVAGRLHPKTHVPVAAILMQGACALAFLWTGTFEQILNIAGYGLAVIGVLVVSTIFVIRRRTDFSPAFRTPLYPVPPLIFLAVSFWSLGVSFYDQPKTSAISLACIMSGLPIYFLFRKQGVNRIKSAPRVV